MKVYKFKCDSCGSKRCIKVDDGYKCEYCESVQDVIMPPAPEIKEPEINYDAEADNQPVQITGRQKSILIRLIVCIIVGCFGVHKFLEGRVLTGIIYAFTGGLFGVGVFIDAVRYILNLMESKHSGGED